MYTSQSNSQSLTLSIVFIWSFSSVLKLLDFDLWAIDLLLGLCLSVLFFLYLLSSWFISTLVLWLLKLTK